MPSTDPGIHLAERDGVAARTLGDGRANAIGRAFLGEMGERLDEISCRRTRYPNRGDQEVNDRSEQSPSMAEPFYLGDWLGMILGSEIANNHVWRPAMNPISDGRSWDVQLGKEVSISGLAD
ncbi:MAG: hypothetical protein GY910_05590 [bacterium]|nr:hypothetical protein [Deltaproteobacteria bacterium]MCP4904433.1 hypothetical protein [bacterium]